MNRRPGVLADPLISVVMPVSNGAAYLNEAIRSILAQSHTHWELIVVDGGSTDGSVSAASAFAAHDRRIRVMTVPGSRGRAINAGVDAARGEMIARMDADDIAVPERFAIQLAWMRGSGVEVCGGYSMLFGDHHGVLWVPTTHEGISRELLFRYALIQPTVLMHAAILREHRYSEQATFEGYELFTRLVLHHRVGNVPAVLLGSRSHLRQAHVVEAAGCRADMRACRGPLLYALFPDADGRDLDLIERVAERESFATIAELERAGGWLLRLARSSDPVLRRRMLGRWRTSCRRSAHLGIGVYRTYLRVAPGFGVAAAMDDPALRAACGVRLRSGSQLEHAARCLRRGRWWPTRVSAQRPTSLDGPDEDRLPALGRPAAGAG